MKICGYCGRENEENAAYCVICGLSEFAVPAEIGAEQPEPVEAVVEIPEPDIGPDSEAAICPFCLFPNLPTRKWCKQCGAPVDNLTTLGPFESALAWGCMWRGAVRNKPKPFVLLGVWCIFLPGFCAGLLLVLCALFFFNIPVLVVGLLYAAIPFSMLYQVTRNYVTLPKPTLEE
jgi:hypothetical protein